MVSAEAAVQLGAISMVKRDGTHSRFALDKRRYILGPGEQCDVRINVQQTDASREQAQIEIDENNQAWFTPLGGTAAIVSRVPVYGRCQLEDDALIEIGSRHFVFHAPNFPGNRLDPDVSNPPSKPVPSPFAKGARREGSPLVRSENRHHPLPLGELTFSSPHPTPGNIARDAQSTTSRSLRQALTARAEPATPSTVVEEVSTFVAGQEVLAWHRTNGWQQAVVATVRVDGKYLLNWLDGEETDRLKTRTSLRNGLDESSSRLYSTAEADAHHILAEAKEQAKQIIACAEADARKIRADARAHFSTSQRVALAQAERCIAFFDKMVCLNFLEKTRDMAPTSAGMERQLSLEDARALLHQSGFSTEDVHDILRLMLASEQEDTSTKCESPSSSTCSDVPPMQTHARRDHLDEDQPSTPGKRALSSPDQALLETLRTRCATARKLDCCEQSSPAVEAAGKKSDQATPGAGQLHPSIRKHPILNWLKKYDPTKDQSVVRAGAAMPAANEQRGVMQTVTQTPSLLLWSPKRALSATPPESSK